MRSDKVLLIFPPHNLEQSFGRGKRFIHAEAPLGLLSIAAVLQESRVDVEFLDAFALGMNLNDVINIVGEKQPCIVGISCLTSAANVVSRLGKELKRLYPNITVVLGNIHASVFADSFLNQRCADVVIHGEGEYTMLELVRALRVDGLRNVQGISWRNGDELIHNEPRSPIDNLDQLPLPARHLAPMHKYRLPYYFEPTLSRGLITSRGCPNRCTFCAVNSSKYRCRSPEKVVDEIQVLIDRYRARFVFFYDPLFMGNKKRAEAVCEEIIKRKVNIKWGCEGHANFVTPELLKKMKAAGCKSIAYGIESGVQNLLDNVRKNTTIESIREAIAQTKKAGINAVGLFMLGIPGETREMSLQTIKFAKELPLDFAQFAILVPYPGSELYKTLVDQGTLTSRDWDRYSAYISFTDKDPVYAPEGMAPSDLRRLQLRAIREFYLRPRYIISELKKIRPYNLTEVFYAARAVLHNG